MLKSEFIERTGYTPIVEWGDGYTIAFSEYDYIERAYYDFDGNKDEFCRAWLNDFKSGAWAKQLILMRRMDALTEHYNDTIREKDETIEFYREQFDKLMAAEKRIKELENKLSRIQRIINQ